MKFSAIIALALFVSTQSFAAEAAAPAAANQAAAPAATSQAAKPAKTANAKHAKKGHKKAKKSM